MQTFNNELYHYGVINMKWGRRRYQNKDGTLTPLGKKRADKLRKQYLDLTGKKQLRGDKPKQSTQPDKPKHKSISEMSDDELQKLINRKRLEQQYSQLSPKKVSAGKNFVDKVLLPAATEAGKKALSSYMEKQFRAALKVPAQNDGKKKDK